MLNELGRAEDRLSDFTRDRRLIVISAMAVFVGVMSVGVAWLLLRLIALFTNLAFHHRLSAVTAEPGAHLGGWMVVIPVLGGLVIGLLARFGSERIRGHGIPEAIEAILFGRSRMDVRVAVLKPLSSAIAIGTGGPFGAEGPVIMTGGAFASLFAQLFHLSSSERKTLLVAGAVGGMSAVFGSPLAAVLLAVELLLFEWRPRSFIPAAISAAVAGTLRVPLLGAGPLFPVTPHAPLDGIGLVAAFGLGIACGISSGILTSLVYFFEDVFQRLPIHWMWWPALGGAAVGLGGWVEPRALGVGYPNIHALLTGTLVGRSAVVLLLVKALVWSIALGSGTSGGVLAPLLMMGGALGSVLAPWLPLQDHGLWATIGMAAIMGGTMRSPLTAIAFALELTHDLNLLPGLLVACIASHGFTVLVMRRSILTEKIARRGRHVMREYAVDPLTLVRVGDVMDRAVGTMRGDTPLADLAARMSRHDPELFQRDGLVLVNPQGAPVGIVTRGDVMAALADSPSPSMLVGDASSTELIVAYPDETVHDAALRMVRNGVGRLPVVTRDRSRTLVGYLGRAEVLSARLHQYHEEHVREPGWLDRRAWS
jgi:H+/Cl- antiporter ClcA